MASRPRGPDTAVQQKYDGNDWIDTLYSRTNRYRAVITRDTTGVHRIYRERWDDSDWNVGGTPWWQREEKSTADSISRARLIARELLNATPDGAPADDSDDRNDESNR